MSPESRQPIPVEKVGIPIPADQVTPEMRMNAIGSPERVGAGVLRAPEQAEATEAQELPATEVLGDTVVASQVEVDASSVGSPSAEKENPYDKLFQLGDDEAAPFDPEDAAVRSLKSNVPPSSTSLRTDYWKPATPAQIEEGKKHGLDLAAHNAKYYPYSSDKK